MKKYRKLIIKASEIVRAAERAAGISDEWQAQCLEVLLIPRLYRRWREVNIAEFRKTDPTLVRHPGRAHRGFTPEQNGQIRKRNGWAEYASYVLFDGQYSRWNSVREDYFSHSAGTAWDGLRRDYIHGFIEGLRQIVAMYQRNGQWDEQYWEQDFRQRGIVLVNDLEGKA